MAAKGNKKQLTLTQALAQFLEKTLLPDLTKRAAEPSVHTALMRQWEAEKAAHRTADGFLAWERRTLEQVGAAWVLSCVFVRTLEDRDLLSRRRLAGAGAADSEQLFFEIGPSLTARDYLLTVFKEVGSLPGAEELLGPRYNPVWRLAPSTEKARELLEFFHRRDEQGELAWRFEGDDTRFLGDLYQDLSAEVRKRYALLQTPDFVERFILEQTLEPAIVEFGLETVRVIDPTCGSGHFLLGAFDRLLSHRQREAPAVDVRDHATAALGQVYGVDVNPYAVAIARFRLTLAYLRRTGIVKLAQAPRLPLNLVVADSLLHGGGKGAEFLLVEQDSAEIDRAAWHESMFALEDEATGRRVLRQRYHAVVGNPPYITCKDSALREVYRERYRSAAGKYALAAPFTERFFELANEAGGFVGLINANSFMKREFGKTLIQDVLPQFDLTTVIDTSGAYIPGHGTPTVVLFGRNRRSTATHLRAVLGKRGEPTTPEDAERGLVWQSIVTHGNDVGFEDDYISVAEMPRTVFNVHPWSLGGGGAADLKALLEERAERTLADVVSSVGITSFTLEDDVYLAPREVLARAGVSPSFIRSMVIGEAIRDWSVGETPCAFFPYDESYRPLSPDNPQLRYLWPYRTNLSHNKLFGGKTKIEGGLKWYEHGRLTADKLRTPLSIAFAFVATHNHFVLDRGGSLFNRSAPIVKMQDAAAEEDHLALLAYLNSSIACFWMKQVFYPKASASGDISIEKGKPEANRYEFAATGLGSLPLPDLTGDTGRWLVSAARRLLDLSEQQSRSTGEAIVAAVAAGATADIADLLSKRQNIQRAMATIQEDIDWATYALFGLADDFQPTVGTFEIDERPFHRHEEMVPVEWRLRKRRAIDSDDIKIVEDIVYKRPWWGRQGVFGHGTKTFAEEISAACKAWLRDRGEQRLGGRIRTFRSLATTMLEDVNVARVLRLYSVGSQRDDVEGVAEILASGDAVPFCTVYVFSEQGLRTFAQWRNAWELQRREDLGDTVGEIRVPEKYDQKDYRDPVYWRLRGKLGVPGERFISYPGCEKEGDPGSLIGSAGWNHLQRAQALVALYQERKNDDGWSTERLMPMLVGLHELMFWLELWHSTPEGGSQDPAREFKQFLDAELHSHHLTVDDLEAWRPPTRNASARRATTTTETSATEAFSGVVEAGIAKPKRTRRRKADAANETP